MTPLAFTDPAALTRTTATLSVRPTNSGPVANDDDGLLALPNTTSIVPVLMNDTDADGDPLTISFVALLTFHGRATISPDGKTVRYEPDANYTGEDVVRYKISDGTAESLEASVRLLVGFERRPVVLSTVIAESGQSVPIERLTAGNGPFGASRSFNATGNLAARVTFTDRTQTLVKIEVP